MTTYVPYQSPVLRQLIEQTLEPLGLSSANATELLLGTIAQESLFGTLRVQEGGPARGIAQMEAEDFNDIWNNFLQYHMALAQQVEALNNGTPGTVDDLTMNDPYAIAMCRIHYDRRPGQLPDATNLTAIYNYYKTQYNSGSGAATQEEFFEHYKEFVTDGVAS